MFYFLLDQKVNKKPGVLWAMNYKYETKLDLGFSDMLILVTCIKSFSHSHFLIPIPPNSPFPKGCFASPCHPLRPSFPAIEIPSAKIDSGLAFNFSQWVLCVLRFSVVNFTTPIPKSKLHVAFYDIVIL